MIKPKPRDPPVIKATLVRKENRRIVETFNAQPAFARLPPARYSVASPARQASTVETKDVGLTVSPIEALDLTRRLAINRALF
jgi:hypothetical protein